MMDATRESRVRQMVATNVEPIIRRSAATSESERRLAPEAMNALIDAVIPVGLSSSGVQRRRAWRCLWHQAV